MSQRDDPVDEIEKTCGAGKPPTQLEKFDIGVKVHEKYVADAPGYCPPPDVIDPDTSELDLKMSVSLAKKRKFLQDDDFNDEEWSKKKTTQECLDHWRQHQSHLLPVDYIDENAFWLVCIPNSTIPEDKWRVRCNTCYENAGRFHLKSRYLSQLAMEEGMLKSSLYDNTVAIEKHTSSISHQVLENELKKEKRHNMLQEMGLLVDHVYENYVTNIFFQLVYNGIFLMIMNFVCV